jgi:tetratricopeptide (TPR) repeat protein
MAFTLLPSEAGFEASLSTLTKAELLPELRRVLATARPLPHYRGSAALAYLTFLVAQEFTKRGILVEALPLFREALAEFTATQGAEHKWTVATAQNLGTCLSSLGQHAEALPLLERALARSSRLEGEESTNALIDLRSVATARRELGNLAGAETLLRQGKATLSRLAVRAGLPSKAPPPGMVGVWSAFNESLAKLLIKKGRLEDAELLLRESLVILADTPESAERNEWMSNLSLGLGTLLQTQGDLLGAEKLYRDILPKLQGTTGYGYVANNLGLLLQKRGLAMESRKYLDIAKQAGSECYGAEHSLTQSARQHRSTLKADLRTCAQCGPIIDKDLVMKVCSICWAARYCGAACQGLHWKAHKPECKRIKAESDAVKDSDGAGPSNA